MKAITTIILDTRREKSTGKYPVKLRVTYQRKQRYYPTGVDLSKEEFIAINKLKPPKELKKSKETIKLTESKAIDTIDELKYFNWDTFETKLNKPKANIQLDELKTIIKKRRQTNTSPEAFLFPILKTNITPYQERGLIKHFTTTINQNMKNIAAKTGIEVPCTTYYARHSFATILKRSGASVEYISEALGHSDIGTTKNYLANFEDKTVKEVALKLIPA